MKLSDSAIAQIAKTLQLAILTGTDIVDNIRLMDFEVDENELYLNSDYVENFNNNLEKMLEKANSSTAQVATLSFPNVNDS